jgi:hypothetical protein
VISLGLILISATVTAAAVALAGWAVHWDATEVGIAALTSAAGVVAWRSVSNVATWNDDFMPLVSIGDVGCLATGAIGPGVVGRLRSGRSWWVPALVGAMAAFIVNVLVL